MFCGTKFKETLFLRKMNLVLKGWALLLPLQFWPKCLLPPLVQTYTTLQQTILHDLHDIVPEAHATATAHVVYPPAPLPPSPFDPLPSPPSSPTPTEEGFAFYAVRRGRTTGIFTSWSLCHAQVSGWSNNQYKGFHTEQEALAYLQQ